MLIAAYLTKHTYEGSLIGFDKTNVEIRLNHVETRLFVMYIANITILPRI